jgi:hypothetical protein
MDVLHTGDGHSDSIAVLGRGLNEAGTQAPRNPTGIAN